MSSRRISGKTTNAVIPHKTVASAEPNGQSCA